MTTVDIDHERHLSAAELAAIRGPYLRRPAEHAEPEEWVRWAREVDAAGGLARAIVTAADAKAARKGSRR
jgi:hypothetical protein